MSGRSRPRLKGRAHYPFMPKRAERDMDDSLAHLSAVSATEIERGRKIRDLREKEGLSQAALGAIAGISRSHVSKIEKGQDNPGRELLGKIAMHFRVSLDWLEGASGLPNPIKVQTAEEAELLEAWRTLPEDEKRLHFQLIMSRARIPKP